MQGSAQVADPKRSSLPLLPPFSWADLLCVKGSSLSWNRDGELAGTSGATEVQWGGHSGKTYVTEPALSHLLLHSSRAGPSLSPAYARDVNSEPCHSA